MRIFNKEYFPCKPNVLVPTFISKKDNIANNIIAYLVLFFIFNFIERL